MTKAKKITLSVFVILLILLAVAALVLFVWWYIQGRSAMDDAAAQVKRNENMVFVNDGYSKTFVKCDLYDDLFGENADMTLSTLPQMTISEEEAFQTAMDFFERYDLSGGYPIKKTDIYMKRNTVGTIDRYYTVTIEIDKPRPEHIINKYAIRKNVYRFFVNDSGVLYVSFQ